MDHQLISMQRMACCRIRPKTVPLASTDTIYPVRARKMISNFVVMDLILQNPENQSIESNDRFKNWGIFAALVRL